MTQQQPLFDSSTNSNQNAWSSGNALVVARARADVLSRVALIIRDRAFLEEAMTAPPTPVRNHLIEVARSQLADKITTTSTVTLTPPPSP